VNSYIHTPLTARRPRNHTPADLILARLVRDAMNPDWSPGPASTELINTGCSAHFLRHTRAKLLRAVNNRRTRAGYRAVAALTIAIQRLDPAQNHRTGSPPRIPLPRTG
jgi:hypothetical protein